MNPSPIEVLNARLGFANNSSSTHSMIFLDDGAPTPKDRLVEEQEFGWELFTAASPEAKLSYLGQTIYYSLTGSCGEQAAAIIANQLVGVPIAFDGYVDHQSRVSVPVGWDGKGVDFEFVDHFKKFLLDDRLVILGGNDNDGEVHELAGPDALTPRIREWYGVLVARYDPATGEWTLFNRETGAKVRFRFARDMRPSGKRPSWPELVDLKVTDFCPFGCSFCYQSSTKAGRHGDKDHVRRVAYALGELRVFEVAIGGGEPTFYPHFDDLLKTFRRVGVVPNFTTRNTAWLHDPDRRPKIVEHCGSFAFSVGDESDVANVVTAVDYHKVPREKLSIQVPMGTLSRWEFARVIRKCAEYGVRVTLLGYKDVGFGASRKPEPYDWWLDEVADVKQGRGLKLGVDTVMVRQYEPRISEKVPGVLYNSKEGVWSCYVDAVEGFVAPSSFCPESERVALDTERTGSIGIAEAIADAFASFPA